MENPDIDDIINLSWNHYHSTGFNIKLQTIFDNLWG